MADKRGYITALLANSRRFKNMDKATIAEMLKILRAARSDIAARLAGAGTNFQVYALRELTRSIEREISQLESALSRLAAQSTINAYELGVESLAEPFRALGYQASFYRPSTSQINILTDFSADLIRNVSAETIAKINTAVRSGILGGRTPLDTMERINSILGVDNYGRMMTKGVSIRAERIFRTENMRVFNLAHHSQQQAMSGMFPGLLKRWLATGDSRTRDTHLEAHIRYSNNPIPADEPFVVGGEELMYPLDPAGSPENTINCRCTEVTIHPEIGVIGTPLDSAVTREIGKREKSGDE
jgi:uncharacterized protein with gpF-like domain